jgi:hypothetical protein
MVSPVQVGSGGGKGIRTPDPLLAKQVLSQLSYAPTSSRHYTGQFSYADDLGCRAGRPSSALHFLNAPASPEPYVQLPRTTIMKPLDYWRAAIALVGVGLPPWICIGLISVRLPSIWVVPGLVLISITCAALVYRGDRAHGIVAGAYLYFFYVGGLLLSTWTSLSQGGSAVDVLVEVGGKSVITLAALWYGYRILNSLAWAIGQLAVRQEPNEPQESDTDSGPKILVVGRHADA